MQVVKIKLQIDFSIPRNKFETVKEEEMYLWNIKKKLEGLAEIDGCSFCQDVQTGYVHSAVSQR